MNCESVKVAVRCRPLNKKEKDLRSKSIIEIDSSLGQCSIYNPHEPDSPPKPFTFDGTYDVDSTTEQLYNEIVFPIVESVTEGYNGTVFAYGQTGCGKSFTMQGVTSPSTQKGIIPRAFEHIFEAIASTADTKFLVHASYLEIYNEEIRDLLGDDPKRKLELKESPEKGVFVSGLSYHPIHDVKQCERLMEFGWKNRSVGATLMNTDSSRSHAVFSVHLERMETGLSSTSDTTIRKGRLNLVDLAGSERQAKTGATGDRLKEATKINLSLSALGNVISALVDGKCTHIPYRDSKLTRLLQDSLGGNTKTLMIACLSPANYNYDETLSTLRYANRAKNIQNKPKINEDPKDALLREYQQEIQRLKSLLSSPDQKKSELETDKDLVERMKQEYDAKMQDLIAKHRKEQERNAQLESDMNRLKQSFHQKAKHQEEQELVKDLNNNDTQTITLKSLEANQDGNTDDNITQIGVETIERIQALQEQMVGGEKVNDPELREKRSRRKRIAERRLNAITEALKKVDDDDQLLLKAYGDITEELRARTLLLKKAKRKISTLESEVKDIQSEFESERGDYLETIRRQDQQIKLLSQITDRIQSCIRKDCNYANIDRIKSESVWDEDMQKWRLPDLTVSRTTLPPPQGSLTISSMIQPGGRESTRSSSPQLDRTASNYGDKNFRLNETNERDGSEFKLFRKLEDASDQSIAANYFKPKRRDELLNHFRKITHLNECLNGMTPNSLLQKGGEDKNSANDNPVDNLMRRSKMPPVEQHSFDDGDEPKKHGLLRQFSKSLPSTRNGKDIDFSNGGGTLSAGEVPRKPFRLKSIKVER
ncbi:osmotic avoidance abnormal protein 3-like isoform X2 [Brevipalpus obovatus]|uniref:osmotic avoidance abnormal protein 3-like isoform X2 n=1 Tax=Brevipalpus obovatus TaxID=246614 RepID=UPI003D9E97D3